MNTKDLDTIDDLVKEINDLKSGIRDSSRPEGIKKSQVLFRGQSNADWDLKTSLERYTKKDYSIKEYDEVLWASSKAVEAFTEKQWNVQRESILGDEFMDSLKNINFMIYARHHGFPTPLLDWTQSLYVALFFAYQKASLENRVAIYVYIDTAFKIWDVSAPNINLVGEYANTHKRHFQQQAQYTFAVNKVRDIWGYCSHESVFQGNGNTEQDKRYKFTLPGKMKYAVLGGLSEMNINAFTLYSNEESLMEMLAFKEIVQRNFDNNTQMDTIDNQKQLSELPV